MLYIICGALITVLCFIGVFSKAEKIKQYLFIGILIILLIPMGAYTISHFKDSGDEVKYFKCDRCGEICTATKNEYQYDAKYKSYYLMHDCPRYVPDIKMSEIDKKDALEELRLKDNSATK